MRLRFTNLPVFRNLFHVVGAPKTPSDYSRKSDFAYSNLSFRQFFVR